MMKTLSPRKLLKPGTLTAAVVMAAGGFTAATMIGAKPYGYEAINQLFQPKVPAVQCCTHGPHPSNNGKTILTDEVKAIDQFTIKWLNSALDFGPQAHTNHLEASQSANPRVTDVLKRVYYWNQNLPPKNIHFLNTAQIRTVNTTTTPLEVRVYDSLLAVESDEPFIGTAITLKLQKDGSSYRVIDLSVQNENRVIEFISNAANPTDKITVSDEVAADLQAARLKLHVEDYAGAYSLCSEAIAKEQNLAVAYYIRACALYGLNKHGDAIKDLDRSILLNPKLSASYNNRGISRIHLGDVEAGFADLDKAISLSPTYGYWHTTKGYALSLRGRRTEAIKEFNTAMQMDEFDGGAYCLRGLTLDGMGKSEEGLQDIASSFKLDERSSYARFSRAFVLDKLDRTCEAIADANDAIELKPNDSQYYWGRGHLYARIGDHNAALADFDLGRRLQLKSCRLNSPEENSRDLQRTQEAIDVCNKSIALESDKKRIETLLKLRSSWQSDQELLNSQVFSGNFSCKQP